MKTQQLRDIVIVLPGIMGSVLRKGETDIWAATWGAFYRGIAWRGLADQLVFDESDEAGGKGDDRVRPTGLVSLPSIFPRFWKTDGYTAIREMIASRFRVKLEDETTPGNYYDFPYDWRGDNRAAARALEAFVGRVLPAWRRHSNNSEAKVILIGHSMGGLVARHYTEVLGGWRECRALITLGTPHRGSVGALDLLANGLPWPLSRLSEVARTFPSIYQLLPIYPVFRTAGDPLRLEDLAELPGIDKSRVAAGIRFHREIEAAVVRNRSEAAYHETHAIIPFVGTDQPTLSSAVIESGRIIVDRQHPGWIDGMLAGGDGTVPRVSATPTELSNSYRERFLPEHHGVLQSNRHLLDSLAALLAQLQSRGMSAIRGPATFSGSPEPTAISLDVGDVHPLGSAIEIRAWARDEVGGSWELGGVVTPVDPPRPPIPGAFRDSGGGPAWIIEGLAPGTYQVEARPARGGPGSPSPVRDLFAVIPDPAPATWTDR